MEETFPSPGKLAGGRGGQGHSATCHVPLWSPRLLCIIKAMGKVMLELEYVMLRTFNTQCIHDKDKFIDLKNIILKSSI